MKFCFLASDVIIETNLFVSSCFYFSYLNFHLLEDLFENLTMFYLGSTDLVNNIAGCHFLF